MVPGLERRTGQPRLPDIYDLSFEEILDSFRLEFRLFSIAFRTLETMG
jgi:hypothetical protein